MSNYLMLDGKQIDLTDEQIAEIKTSIGLGDVELATVKVGGTFKIGKYEFFLLEHFGGSSAVLLKGLLNESEQFGSNNNYNGSNADKLCIEFGEEIARLVGAENLIEHMVDLTADDGLKCYGSVERKMSLLTAEQYRKYVYTIDEHKLDKWWWTATAYSTPVHDGETWVKCVSPLGNFDDYDYFSNNGGVRPFCILKSNIFVSK